ATRSGKGRCAGAVRKLDLRQVRGLFDLLRPVFRIRMEGHLEHAPDRPELLHFFGSQTSFRASVGLDRCVAIKAPERDDRAIVMLLQGATGPSLLICDPKRPVPDVTKLLKLSGGQPN